MSMLKPRLKTLDILITRQRDYLSQVNLENSSNYSSEYLESLQKLRKNLEKGFYLTTEQENIIDNFLWGNKSEPFRALIEEDDYVPDIKEVLDIFDTVQIKCIKKYYRQIKKVTKIVQRQGLNYMDGKLITANKFNIMQKDLDNSDYRKFSNDEIMEYPFWFISDSTVESWHSIAEFESCSHLSLSQMLYCHNKAM